jgi:hypothetical protein
VYIYYKNIYRIGLLIKVACLMTIVNSIAIFKRTLSKQVCTRLTVLSLQHHQGSLVNPMFFTLPALQLQLQERRFQYLPLRLHCHRRQEADSLQHCQQQDVRPALRLQGFVGKSEISIEGLAWAKF